MWVLLPYVNSQPQGGTHYREPHSLLFNFSHIVKVTFFAMAEKLDMFHSSIISDMFSLYEELCLYLKVCF